VDLLPATGSESGRDLTGRTVVTWLPRANE